MYMNKCQGISINKIRLIFFLLSFSGLCMTGCTRDCSEFENDKLCTAEELSWITYRGGEFLVFESSTGVIDTAFVKRAVSTIERGHHEREDPCDHNYQSVEVVAQINDIDFTLSVSHFNYGNYYNENSAKLVAGNKEFKFSDFQPQQNIQVGSRTYNDVYVMESDPNHTSDYAVSKVYYTRNDGILGWNIKNGEEWGKVN